MRFPGMILARWGLLAAVLVVFTPRGLQAGSVRHINLEEMVATKRFREDLYYRIRVIPIDLPTLADRRKDIPLLVEHFLKILSVRTGKPSLKLSRKAMQTLYDYNYPGNVRELRNIIERAFVLCLGDIIDLEHLPPEVLLHYETGETQYHEPVPRFDKRRNASTKKNTCAKGRFVNSPEVKYLLRVLESHGWNRSATAEELGIGRTTLWRRMKKFGLI